MHNGDTESTSVDTRITNTCCDRAWRKMGKPATTNDKKQAVVDTKTALYQSRNDITSLFPSYALQAPVRRWIVPDITKKQLTVSLLSDLKKANAQILDAKTMRPVSAAALKAMGKGTAAWGFSAWIKI
jgi:hypothetical protein